MKVQAIECALCGYIIYSRALHDCRSCECGQCSIDGGFDYLKITAPNLADIKVHEIDLPLTRIELYQDWNEGTDKYGKVSPCGLPLSLSSWCSLCVADES